MRTYYDEYTTCRSTQGYALECRNMKIRNVYEFAKVQEHRHVLAPSSNKFSLQDVWPTRCRWVGKFGLIATKNPDLTAHNDFARRRDDWLFRRNNCRSVYHCMLSVRKAPKNTAQMMTWFGLDVTDKFSLCIRADIIILNALRLCAANRGTEYNW